MPITDSGVVTIGASAPLAGMYQSVAGQTNPTGYPLNNLRQGTGKYWRAADNTPTTNTTRQLGLLRNTKYRSLVGQSQQATFVLATSPGENINIQGNLYGPSGAGAAGGDADAFFLSQLPPGTPGGAALDIQNASSDIYILTAGDIQGGDGGGGGGSAWLRSLFQQTSPQYFTPGGNGGNGGAGIINNALPMTVYVKSPSYTIGPGSGGGAGGGGMYYPQPDGQIFTTGGNGGGGGASLYSKGGGGGGGGGGVPKQSNPITAIDKKKNGNPGIPGSAAPGQPNYGSGGAAMQALAGGLMGAGGNGGGAFPSSPIVAAGTNGQANTVYPPGNGVLNNSPGIGGSLGGVYQGNVVTIVTNSQGTVV